jgi:hypothetical protein
MSRKKKMSRKKNKRTALLIGLSSVLALATAVFLYREELRMRWICHDAHQELASGKFSPKETPPNVEALFEAGARGYPYLAELLRSPEYPVWTNLTYLIDKRLEVETRRSFVDRLRRTDVLALVRYLLIEPYDAETNWREDLSPLLPFWFAFGTGSVRGASTRGYWTGSTEGTLDTSELAIGFLASVLDRDIDYVGDDDYYHRFELRAVSALGCMLAPAAPEGPGEHGAARILARVAKQHPEIEVSLYAAYHLLCSSESTHPRLYQRMMDWELDGAGSPARPGFFQPGHGLPSEDQMTRGLYPLAFVGDARGFDMLLKLQRIGLVSKSLWGSLPTRDHGLPLEWTTTTLDAKHARGLLDADARAQAIGANTIALLEDWESIPALRRIAGSTDDKTVRIVTKAALLTLGEDIEWKDVLARFLELLESSFASQPLTFFDVDELPPELTPFVFPRQGNEDGRTAATWPAIDSDVSQYVQRWRQGLDTDRMLRSRHECADLASALCGSGRRETLDAVVEYLLETASDGMISGYANRNGSGVGNGAFQLDDFLDLPFAWMYAYSPIRGTAVSGTSYRSQLRTWWEKHSKHLVWDAKLRRWRSTLSDD